MESKLILNPNDIISPSSDLCTTPAYVNWPLPPLHPNIDSSFFAWDDDTTGKTLFSLDNINTTTSSTLTSAVFPKEWENGFPIFNRKDTSYNKWTHRDIVILTLKRYLDNNIVMLLPPNYSNIKYPHIMTENVYSTRILNLFDFDDNSRAKLLFRRNNTFNDTSTASTSPLKIVSITMTKNLVLQYPDNKNYFMKDMDMDRINAQRIIREFTDSTKSFSTTPSIKTDTNHYRLTPVYFDYPIPEPPDVRDTYDVPIPWCRAYIPLDCTIYSPLTNDYSQYYRIRYIHGLPYVAVILYVTLTKDEIKKWPGQPDILASYDNIAPIGFLLDTSPIKLLIEATFEWITNPNYTIPSILNNEIIKFKLGFNNSVPTPPLSSSIHERNCITGEISNLLPKHPGTNTYNAIIYERIRTLCLGYKNDYTAAKLYPIYQHLSSLDINTILDNLPIIMGRIVVMVIQEYVNNDLCRSLYEEIVGKTRPSHQPDPHEIISNFSKWKNKLFRDIRDYIITMIRTMKVSYQEIMEIIRQHCVSNNINHNQEDLLQYTMYITSLAFVAYETQKFTTMVIRSDNDARNSLWYNSSTAVNIDKHIKICSILSTPYAAKINEQFSLLISSIADLNKKLKEEIMVQGKIIDKRYKITTKISRGVFAVPFVRYFKYLYCVMPTFSIIKDNHLGYFNDIAKMWNTSSKEIWKNDLLIKKVIHLQIKSSSIPNTKLQNILAKFATKIQAGGITNTNTSTSLSSTTTVTENTKQVNIPSSSSSNSTDNVGVAEPLIDSQTNESSSVLSSSSSSLSSISNVPKEQVTKTHTDEKNINYEDIAKREAMIQEFIKNVDDPQHYPSIILLPNLSSLLSTTTTKLEVQRIKLGPEVLSKAISSTSPIDTSSSKAFLSSLGVLPTNNESVSTSTENIQEPTTASTPKEETIDITSNEVSKSVPVSSISSSSSIPVVEPINISLPKQVSSSLSPLTSSPIVPKPKEVSIYRIPTFRELWKAERTKMWEQKRKHKVLSNTTIVTEQQSNEDTVQSETISDITNNRIVATDTSNTIQSSSISTVSSIKQTTISESVTVIDNVAKLDQTSVSIQNPNIHTSQPSSSSKILPQQEHTTLTSENETLKTQVQVLQSERDEAMNRYIIALQRIQQLTNIINENQVSKQ